MTKRQVVYEVLRERANEWVNGNDLVAAGAGYRFGGRIYELRQAGHAIEERPSKTSAVHEYRLRITSVDVAPGQIPLFGEAA